MKGCLTIGASYERVTAKSKAFVQEMYVLEPDSVYQRRVVGRTGSHVFIRIYRIPKTAFSEGSLLLQVISIWVPSYCHLSRSSSVSKN